MKLPVVGITMGDPAGVGPEVIMKALARAEAYAACRPLVIGDARQMQKAKTLLKSKLVIFPVSAPGKAKFKPGTVNLMDLALLSAEVVETMSPIRVRRSALVPGSGGAGEHRGGLQQRDADGAR